MRNVSRDQIVANFEELVTENQVQTAVELLTGAEPDDQLILVEQADPALLDRLFQSLSVEERVEVANQLAEEARQALATALQGGGQAEVAAPPGTLPVRVAPSPTRRDFAISRGRLVEASPATATVSVYANPTAQEQRALLDIAGIDEHTLASALDPDEISRFEFDPDTNETVIIWTRPIRGARDHPEALGLASMGMFLNGDHLTVVTEDERPLLRAGDRADSLRDLVLRIMASTVNEFLVELKTTKRTSQEIGEKLARSLENRQLLRMFDLSEGLVYHISALEANGGALRRLRAFSRRLGFDEADAEFLEDIIVDNTQCINQARTFSTVLAGLMDARGNLINNNMNVLLKNLTLINVVFLPLGVIASMGGMSEFSRVLDDHHINWWFGYAGFTAMMFLLGYVLFRAVTSWSHRMFGK